MYVLPCTGWNTYSLVLKEKKKQVFEWVFLAMGMDPGWRAGRDASADHSTGNWSEFVVTAKANG